ncbi:hypothetical protein ACH40F_29310 [Streptomyces sp. NPDC020794]|uniref:hypothetical protein n=1 Tax=unclassified Streptomyces TaxID=2593676 RepID=UPI0036E9FBCB
MRTNHIPAVDTATTGRLPCAAQPAEPVRSRAEQPETDGAREHTEQAAKTVTVMLRPGQLDDDGSTLVLWSYLKGGQYDIEAAYDDRTISRAGAEKRLRAQLANRGMDVSAFLNDDGAREHIASETPVTYKAAALYVATAAYNEALTTPNPAATLDDMRDALPEIMPDVCKVVSAAREFTETLRATIADYLRAYTAIEHARIEAGDGYSYLFDLLAEGLQNGVDPQITRTTALAAPGRIRELAKDCA